MKNRSYQGFTLVEFTIVVVIVAIIASFVIPWGNRVPFGNRQTSHINNVKQISLACAIFATDHAGQFPNGNYDPVLGEITNPTPASSAEACFNDLIRSEKLEVEKIFWSPHQPTQCSPAPPDEDGVLTASENCWDYIAGLSNSSLADLPLVFEASDGGAATHWSKAGGHPWDDLVIVGYVDGSAAKANLNRDDEAKTNRGGAEVDLCLPTPGKDGWPDTAKLAPATPISNSTP